MKQWIRQGKRKLRSRAGETITETLIALLIASLSLVMLAGAITAANRIIGSSKDKMKEYYEKNELVVQLSAGTTAAAMITQKEDIGTVIESDIAVRYIVNDAFKTHVTGYKAS